jgi:hypothetical protein
MAYLVATGRISGVTVLNHCVNSKEPASQQLTNGKKGGTLYVSIHEELQQTNNIFNYVIFNSYLLLLLSRVFFNPAHKYIPVK